MNPFKLLVNLMVHKIVVLYRHTGPNPFVQDFKNHILSDVRNLPDFESIEKRRSRLLRSTTLVSNQDFGAGSRSIPGTRTVGRITRAASVNSRYGRLLYRMASYYRPSKIIELGTAAGISTMYLASGNREADVITVEGNPGLAILAAGDFEEAGLNNVTVMNCKFDEVLEQLAENMPPESLVYIDGNHTTEATLRYFSFFTGHTGMNSILIFDDINWSPGMRSAWEKIRQQAKGGTLIDLFYMGIYFTHLSSPLQFLRFNY